MGVVFTAYDEELDRKVAIKFLLHAHADDRALLLSEAQAMARQSRRPASPQRNPMRGDALEKFRRTV